MDKGNFDSINKTTPCPMEQVPLDTVRALHSTVVSLRSALEEAKFEIQRLRKQISTETEIKEGSRKPEKTLRFDLHNINDTDLKINYHCHPCADIKQLEIPEILEIQSVPNTPKINNETYRKSTNSNRDSDTSLIAIPTICERPKVNFDKKMAQKIDVKIKVTSNIKVGPDGSVTQVEQQSDELRSCEEQKPGEFTFTTQENFSVRSGKNDSYVIVQTSKENLHSHPTDDSPSEGDNSVFENTKSFDQKPTETNEDSKEECDDIELIFSSEEQKYPIQEEMISLTEYDPWKPSGETGTPVLLKFSSFQSDHESPQNSKRLLTTSSTFDDLPKEKSLDSSISLDVGQQFSLDKELSFDENSNFGQPENPILFNCGISGKKWTNRNVVVETDISKCGISEETNQEFYNRRNTCPNPPTYRPKLSRIDPVTRYIPSRLASKYSRRVQHNTSSEKGPKRSSSAQTEISALPELWKSEYQLTGNRYHIGAPCTLPSKFVPTAKKTCQKHIMRISDRTREARRVLLSDINFTSMVPELSRSADHLCQDENHQGIRSKQNQTCSGYYKGNLLKTPDYLTGITTSTSITSPGLSQWTISENNFGTQTIQTGEWVAKRGDSLDSCKSYGTSYCGSRLSGLDRHHRSRSVPSIRCGICKQNTRAMKTSENMNYTPRVTFQEPNCKIRGSLPDLRHDCTCPKRNIAARTVLTIHGDSSGSTDSLLDEADAFVRKSLDGNHFKIDYNKRPNVRRMSENDIQRDCIPSKQSLPFLPKTPNCLKVGHLAKVITKSGRVVVGRVRFVGPITIRDNEVSNCHGSSKLLDDFFVGIQLQSKCGDCDGIFEGKKFFECEPLQATFVPFKKVIMAWTE